MSEVEYQAGRLSQLRHGPLVVILLAFGLLACCYSVVNPLYEGTDELRHFRFVRVLAETGKLPVQGQEPARSQSHHPPLYYAVSAAATFWLPHQGDPYLTRPENPYWGYRYWEVGTDNKAMYLHGPDERFPWSGDALAAHIARLVNVCLGLATVMLTAATCLTIVPGRPAIAYGAAGLVAFNPMFLYMSGTINNDVAAAATGAAVTWACARVLRDGLNGRRAVALGVSYGLGILAKLNLIFLLPVIESVLLYRSFCPPFGQIDQPGAQVCRIMRGSIAFVRANGTVLGTAAVIAGWWFVRNALVYGDPTGFREVTKLWGARDPASSLGLAWSELPNAWSSLWGRFGYGQVPLPGWYYRVLAWASAVGGLGLTVSIGRAVAGYRADAQTSAFTSGSSPRSRGEPSIEQLISLLLVVLTSASVLFGYMLVSPAGSMGRFFYPGLAAFSILANLGWTSVSRLILRLLPGRWRQIRPAAVVSLAANLVMCTLAVWALLGYIRPAYARPIHAAPAAGAHLLEVTLSDTDGPLARLIGYQVTPDRALPGGTVDVTLTWQTVRAASNHYVVFVHLLDDLRIIVAQRDTFHGLGNYPTGFWRPDHIFSETYQVILPETAYAPATLSVQVGMYSRERTYRLQPSPATVDNAVALGTVTLDARSADLPNLQDVNFANMIRLVGYRIEPRELEPGDGLLFTLYWQLDHAPDRRIGIILRIVDDYDRTVASYDGMPAWPMAEWPLHVPVEEQRYVAVPENVTTGVYRVEVGAWPEGEANSRLPMIANDGHWIGDRLFLSPIRLGPAQNQ